MIAFACAVSETEPYRRYAEPGIERAREPDSPVLVYAAVDTLARSYNILLDAAARLDGLEALVLVGPYAELTDTRLCAKVRDALRDPDVAVAGCVGARGVDSLAWWEGRELSCSSGFMYAYHEHGGGELPGLPWTTCSPAPAQVDAVDGALLILSPWAVENLRFDEALSRGYGFDVDFCLQAGEAGRKVMTLDIAVTERRPLKIVTEVEAWTEAHVEFSRKWHGRIPGQAGAGDVKARARRMEAEREATRSMVYFERLAYDAQLQPLKEEFETLTRTRSWRLTEPLRWMNLRRHAAAAARAGEDGAAAAGNWGRTD
jgi:hypothetical protein